MLKNKKVPNEKSDWIPNENSTSTSLSPSPVVKQKLWFAETKPKKIINKKERKEVRNQQTKQKQKSVKSKKKRKNRLKNLQDW